MTEETVTVPKQLLEEIMTRVTQERYYGGNRVVGSYNCCGATVSSSHSNDCPYRRMKIVLEK